MKILINPKYNYLEDFINQIPNLFDQEGKVIYSSRNIIKLFSYNGLSLNVKRFGVPHVFNRIIYSYFRKPKGLRAFTYPEILISKGFETPEPIAYMEERTCGLIGHAYFISIQSPYRFRFYQFKDADPEEYADVIKAFARFTARLHEAGIMHQDYSPGNILFDQVDGQYHFSLVDINRMYFGEVSIEQGCANFARLWGNRDFFRLLAVEYAKSRQADVDFCWERIAYYKNKFWKRYESKHSFSVNW